VVPNVSLRTFAEDRCGPGSLALVLNAIGDPVSERDLDPLLPTAPGGGVLSVDLLLAARQRGFDAGLVAGTAADVRAEIGAGLPAILMLRLLDLPGKRRDVFHYVVVDGFDPDGNLFRVQFGDGQARWTSMRKLEKGWAAAGHALLLVRARPVVDGDLLAGVVLEEAGRLEEAVALYRRVLAVRPESARAWTDLGNAQGAQGATEDAEKAYRQALRLSPDDPDALNNLAWLLLQGKRQLEEAEGLAVRAAAVPGPERFQALDTLARVQLARGRCDAAVASFTSALALEGIPEDARAGLEEGLRESRRCGASS
jgi:hypothetical protein